MVLQNKEYVLPQPLNEREKVIFGVIESIARDFKQLSEIYLDKAGDRALTANWDVGDFTVTMQRLIADLADGGLQPLAITSKVKVDNLNADYVDGQHVDNQAASGYIKIGTTLLIAWGWGFIEGNGSDATRTKAVTFPANFSAAPKVIVGSVGMFNSASDPTVISQFDLTPGFTQSLQAISILVSGFTAAVRDYGSTLAADYYNGYSWIAIGAPA